jgi:hypothetical protein
MTQNAEDGEGGKSATERNEERGGKGKEGEVKQLFLNVSPSYWEALENARLK